MKPLQSQKTLARLLGTTVARLYEITGNVRAHYRVWSRWDERKSRVRIIKEPTPELKRIQRRLTNKVLLPLGLHEAAHGGVRGRSPASNASKHLGKACVVTLDAKNFFPSVRHDVVYHLFRHELGMGRDVARLITHLVTLEGSLPVGCPSSTAVGNLLMSDVVDAALAEAAEQLQLEHTRFVDDIALSGSEPTLLISLAARLLSRRRLKMHRSRRRHSSTSKLQIMPSSTRQEVTGLTVNSRRPSLSKPRRDAVRAAVFQLHNIADAKERAKAERSIGGRIEHVRRFNPGSAARLERYLRSHVG